MSNDRKIDDDAARRLDNELSHEQTIDMPGGPIYGDVSILEPQVVTEKRVSKWADELYDSGCAISVMKRMFKEFGITVKEEG